MTTRNDVKLLVYLLFGVALVAVVGVRHLLAALRSRSLRMHARSRGCAFESGPCDVSGRWPGTCLTVRVGNAWNLVEGSRRGRKFAAFDVGVANWYGRTHVWSAVAVDGAIPPGTQTADHRRGFAPWRLEFGPGGLVAVQDGKASAAEFDAVVEELNDVLDAIAGAPPAA